MANTPQGYLRSIDVAFRKMLRVQSQSLFDKGWKRELSVTASGWWSRNQFGEQVILRNRSQQLASTKATKINKSANFFNRKPISCNTTPSSVLKFYSFFWLRCQTWELREIDFLLKRLLINWTSSTFLRLVTWKQIYANQELSQGQDIRAELADCTNVCNKLKKF